MSLWYLACGSMIDPETLEQRGLRPAESHPCVVQDFERRFWGRYGMAEVKEDRVVYLAHGGRGGNGRGR